MKIKFDVLENNKVVSIGEGIVIDKPLVDGTVYYLVQIINTTRKLIPDAMLVHPKHITSII